MWQPGLGAERRHTAAPAGAPGASRPNGGLQRLAPRVPAVYVEAARLPPRRYDLALHR